MMASYSGSIITACLKCSLISAWMTWKIVAFIRSLLKSFLNIALPWLQSFRWLLVAESSLPREWMPLNHLPSLLFAGDIHWWTSSRISAASHFSWVAILSLYDFVERRAVIWRQTEILLGFSCESKCYICWNGGPLECADPRSRQHLAGEPLSEIAPLSSISSADYLFGFRPCQQISGTKIQLIDTQNKVKIQ